MTDETRIGPAIGPPDDAAATDWSMIHRAVHGPEQPARQAWETLARRYWPAIYAFLRRSGHDVHAAADLTQGFVCDVMISRHLLDAADPQRGRFRALLLGALRNYLTDRHRAETRRKRSAERETGRPVLELDRRELREMAVSGSDSPEAAYAAQWSTLLVRRVLERMRRVCQEEALAAHWAVFEARVVKPLVLGEPPTAYSVLVDALDLKDASQAANMMVTVKRRFARALHREVGTTVREAAEIEAELLDLLRWLERSP